MDTFSHRPQEKVLAPVRRAVKHRMNGGNKLHSGIRRRIENPGETEGAKRRQQMGCRPGRNRQRSQVGVVAAKHLEQKIDHIFLLAPHPHNQKIDRVVTQNLASVFTAGRFEESSARHRLFDRGAKRRSLKTPGIQDQHQ